MNVLVLNCGSSSAKFAVIDSATGAEKISGIAQRLDSAHATLDWKLDGQKHSRDLHHADHDLALRTVVELLRASGSPTISPAWGTGSCTAAPASPARCRSPRR